MQTCLIQYKSTKNLPKYIYTIHKLQIHCFKIESSTKNTSYSNILQLNYIFFNCLFYFVNRCKLHLLIVVIREILDSGGT